MNDSFFCSDSLKGVIDEHSLSSQKSLRLGDSKDEVLSVASFVSLSLFENVMTLKVSQHVVKQLIVNEEQVVSYNFMDEIWLLSSRGMKVQQEKDSSFCVTLQINERHKGDTYERTI